jgi:3-methyladenine DNA glycosylase AlkD
MTAQDIINEIKPLGKESYKRTMMNHGIQEPFFGVMITDMKKIVARVKKNYQLALDLYDTGIHDAMYLAGLIADDAKMTKKDLQKWMANARNGMLAEYTVPWVASGSPHGREMALKWIDSKKEDEAAAGWATLSSIVATKDDAELDMAELKKLLERVQKQIHSAPNRVRYVMNGFVIAVGCYVKALSDFAMQTAKKIGSVEMELVGACKIPFAPDYIDKVKKKGAIGKKRKSAKC